MTSPNPKENFSTQKGASCVSLCFSSISFQKNLQTVEWRVNPIDSFRMAEQLYKNKIPFRLVTFEGADHSISEFKEEESKLIFDWFRRFLKNRERLPNLEPHGR